MIFEIKHKNGSYPVVIKRGAISEIYKYISDYNKVLIVSDDGVPSEYSDIVKSQCNNWFLHIIKQGEQSKTIESYSEILKILLENEFSRNDLVIGLGGGVVGDLSGFAASCYMRGIDFLNIPTTTLSQIDSSIGGKTAIDFCGVKNCVGTFHQPVAVIVDPGVLKTLPKRHFNNGLIEAVKSGLIRDKELFSLFETGEEIDIDEVIKRSLSVKKSVVEEDEGESGTRKLLNFGHTLGHGIESASAVSADDFHLLHGEAVAIGMLPMIANEDLKKRTMAILNMLEMPLDATYDKQIAFDFLSKDKKSKGEYITTIRVDIAGEAYLEDTKKEDLFLMLP